jgi:DNA anti-recombination protein RmuC
MADKDLGDGIENFEAEVENLKNTKMKLFGITMTPTTIGMLFALISSILGGLYGAFQVYDDYMGMKEIVRNIDVDVIETRNQEIEASLANVNKEITIQLASIQKQLDDAEKRNRESKVDVRDQMNSLDAQVRRVEKLVRDNEADTRKIVQNAEERFENKRDGLQNDYDEKANNLRDSNDGRMTDLEAKVDRDIEEMLNRVERDIKALEDTLTNKLQRALDNPLAN